jgi:aryl-phospho-beta-D-glucosidase BglC (GH1 family)
MPNTDHSITFWQQAASYFKNDKDVIFDLFNEPYPDRMSGSGNAWKCLRDGGSCDGINFQVAGMQALLNAVRSAGANNVVMIGGLTWANDLSQWLQYVPNDPQNQIAASAHLYNFNGCNNPNCWNS